MTIYAGLDVSDKTTHICVVDADGKVLRRDVVASDPDALAKWLNKHCPDLVRVVLETGTLSTFLYHGLVERGATVECICARHAKGVLSARVNKSDVHDAEGLAQLARTGWYKRVHMKASATHIDRAALRIRSQLITSRTALANQLRGLLKLFGLRMGTARTSGRRAERLTAFYAQCPDLKPLFAPLIASMEAIEEQLRASNRLLNDRAKADEVCNRLMSAPWRRTGYRAHFYLDDRRSAPFCPKRRCWRVCRARAPTQSIRRTRYEWPHLQGWRPHVAKSAL
nr:transposase [Sphingomonas sp. 35-24ZXX]